MREFNVTGICVPDMHYMVDIGGKLAIHNRIFEIAVTDYFISRNTTTTRSKGVEGVSHSEIIRNGVFDMELCLSKFKKHYAEIYTEKDIDFLERDGDYSESKWIEWDGKRIFDVVLTVGSQANN